MPCRLLSIQWLILIALSNVLVMADSLADEQVTKLVYKHKIDGQMSIYVTDGSESPGQLIVNHTVHDGYPAVSPDKTKLAFYGKYDNYKTWSIHIANIDGTDVQRVTQVQNVWDSAPTWSPDGKTIAFAREYKGKDDSWIEQIWLMDADGTNQRLIQPLSGRAPEFISNNTLLFQSKASPSQICMADIDGTNQSCLTDDDTNNMSPKLSPNGEQIAYLSNRDGNQELYVMDKDGSNQKRLTFNEVQDWDPTWSSDGKYIFFSTPFEEREYHIYKVNPKDNTAVKYIENGSQATVIM